MVFIIMSIFTGVYIPHYWDLKSPPIGDNISTGITKEGYSWIGAEQPVVTITEFSDYMCFQCSKMHFFVRQLVEKFPHKLRLVHRHFPMDHLYNPLVEEPFHSGSGKMALMALYAQSKGKFWEISDLLFHVARQKMNFNTRLIANTLEVSKYEVVLALKDKYYRLKLKHDIAVGIDYGIVGTPGFIIDDQVYNGYIPPKTLSELVAKLSQ
jgi:protein-disulfide isomerase